MQVGIINGILQNNVNLLNIKKVNITDGIQIVILVLIQKTDQQKVKLENSHLLYRYLTHLLIKVEN